MLLLFPPPLTILAGVVAALLGAVADDEAGAVMMRSALTLEAEVLFALFLFLPPPLSLLLASPFSSLLLRPLLSLDFSGSSSSEKDSKFSSRA